jgi:hypothetical protein
MNRDQFKVVCGRPRQDERALGDPVSATRTLRTREARSTDSAGIQERRGNSREEFSRQLQDFMRRNRNWYLLNR